MQETDKYAGAPPGQKLSIAYISGPLTAGGAERELVNQAKALRRRGHRVTVMTLGEGDLLEPEVAASGAELLHVNPGASRSRFRRIYEIVQALVRLRPDVVHSQHFYTNPYAWLCGLLAGIPAIGSIQGDLSKALERRPWRSRLLFRGMPWMTANSQRALRCLRAEGYPQNRSFYLVNAVDLEAMRGDEKSGEGALPWNTSRPTAIIVGRLVPVKRHDRFLRVIRKVLDAGTDVQGVVVGDGPEEENLRRQARDLGLDEHIHFLGLRLDVPALLEEADVAVLCSDHEGMPNAVQEAMAAGRAVVASKVGATPELLRDGQDGFLVDPSDISGFVSNVQRLVEDPSLRRRMGESARDRMESDFSLERLGLSLEHIYGQVKGKS